MSGRPLELRTVAEATVLKSGSRGAGALALALAQLAVTATASADPNGGTVSGTIALRPASERPEPPERNRGFLKRRMKNPWKAPETLNPLPELVVVLDGGDVHPDDQTPPQATVRYQLIGESFESPVFPVMRGSRIEIVNIGKAAPRLYSPTAQGLLDETPVKPNQKRKLKKNLEKPFRVVEIRDRDSAHLSGRLVVIPHRYFSRVGESGEFKIIGVPAGTWKVRVWYRDGWAKGTDLEVEVKANRTSRVKIDLPADPRAGKEGE